MKRLLLTLLLFSSFYLYAKQLHFDNNGNLIDKELDKIYAVSYSTVYLYSHNITGFGYQTSLLKLPKLDLNIGFGVSSTLFISITNPLLHLFTKGTFIGYSFKHHEPTYGILLGVSISF